MALNFAQALGQVIRERRNQLPMTQEAFGTYVGYGAGAGISISRLEKGQLVLGAERLEKVARALELEVDELHDLASKRAGEDAGPGLAPPGPERLNEREKRVQIQLAERATRLSELGNAFDEALVQAREKFFLRFLSAAERIDGAPPPSHRPPGPRQASEADAPTARRDLERTADAVAQVIADGTGAAVSSLLLGLLKRGAPVAGVGATAGLVGAVVLPLILLAAGTVIAAVQNNRAQQHQRTVALDDAEAEFASAEPAFKALAGVLPRATEILEYIAVHAGHSVERWETQLHHEGVAWTELSADAQRRYAEFIDILAAEILVQEIDVPRLLSARVPSELEKLTSQIDDTLTQANDVVRAHV